MSMTGFKPYIEGQPIEPSDRPRVYTTIEERNELKIYRDFGTIPQIREVINRYHELMGRPSEQEIRNKAIDEFAERLQLKIMTEIDDCADELDWIDEIAEQLKGGSDDR